MNVHDHGERELQMNVHDHGEREPQMNADERRYGVHLLAT